MGRLTSWLRALDPVARAVDRARSDLRARAGLVRRVVSLPSGVEVAYLDTEADLPPLVLLHGIGASKDHWPRLARHLAGRFRVVAPDLPGFGESSKPVGADYSMPAQAEHVRQFLEALKLGAVHLAGSSMGGRVAAQFAATHPGLVRTLWLLDPAGAEGERHSEMVERVLAGEPTPLFSRTADEYAATLAFTMSRPPDIPRPALRVLAAEGAPFYEHYHRLFDALTAELLEGPSTEDLLRGLALPTLVTWGEEDRVLHVSGADAIGAAMPNATVRRMPGIGHLPMLEDPARTAADYLAFHDALTRGPAAQAESRTASAPGAGG